MAERIFQLLPISAYDVSVGIILIKMLGEKIIRKITNRPDHSLPMAGTYRWASNPIYEAFKPVKQLILKRISVKMKNYFTVCFVF